MNQFNTLYKQILEGYKITAISNWEKPQTFHAKTKEEMKEIVQDLKDQQYKVEVDEEDSEDEGKDEYGFSNKMSREKQLKTRLG